jgi:GNAT superfamily N-acetyltransferase
MTAMRLWVEPSPAGGYVVRAEGSPAPVSRHDTEDDAEHSLTTYARGLSRPSAGTEVVELRDGSEVLVRPVRPEDKPLFVRGFEHFGEQSRYLRFMGMKKRLSTDELSFFTEIDHRDHDAIGAIDPVSGDGLGVARAVVVPGRPEVAEAAVAVIDAWQGRGLGGVLLKRLTDRAIAHGIGCFTATLFTTNTSMLRLFERLGPVRVRRVDAGTMQIDIELPVGGDALRVALRSAATGHVGRAE